MKKYGKSTKKGFTLVELIVVLVILAVLAAMLVPALTGYIKRARQEKDYQMAASVLTAAQAAATYQMTLTGGSTTITMDTDAGNGETVKTLVGDATGNVTCSFTCDSDYFVIESGWVKIGDSTYSYDPTADVMWSASTSS
jgi:type IV pilus assembly protein PilA